MEVIKHFKLIEKTDTNVTINGNGSAQFAGDVAVGKKLTDPTDTVRGIRIKNTEAGSFAYIISNDVQSGGGVSTVYQHLLNGDQTLSLNGDGSATFRGSLRSGAADNNVAVIGTSGIVGVYREDASSKACFQTFVATAPSTPTSQIFSDGSADFAKGYTNGWVKYC